MLFALLRSSLHGGEVEHSYFQGATPDDWKQCYHLSVKQGVMALSWDGVVRLPRELQPPLAIKISWAANVEAYEKRYMKYCKTAVELSGFYAQHGIKTVVLKGVGLSTLYPIPHHREGGDIDIYTYSACKDSISDKDANALADALISRQGITVDMSHTVKHSNFTYQGIPIENHKTFLNVKAYNIAGQMEEFLIRNMKPSLVALPCGEILVPSGAFNTVFVALHTFQHYCAGMTLHHLCDWAMVLSRYGLCIPSSIKDKSFIDGIYALTALCNRYLGTAISVEGDEKLAGDILSEILYPRYLVKVPAKSMAGIFIYKAKRMLYAHKKKSKVLRVSLFHIVWSSIVSHICHPSTIFHR